MIDNVLLGISVAFTPYNVFLCFIGCLLGTVVGVLPGINTITVISIILPFLYGFSPAAAPSVIICLAGIYYGAQYGGSTTSILLKTPGETSNIMTSIDGFALTKQGKSSLAIFVAGVSSFVAGIISLILIVALGEQMTKMSYMFGSSEYTILMFIGLLSVSITNSNPLAGFGLGLIGMLVSSIGIDPNSGVSRFSFNILEIFDGISIGIIAIGIFGIGELLTSIFDKNQFVSENAKSKFRIRESLSAFPAMLRGSFIGSILGVLPGGGAVMSSFAAYAVEKKFDKNVGNGSLAGVAAPEAANNAASQTSFIPLLTLGIPENPVMAMMLASLTLMGIQPGPNMISHNPELFWGLIVSMLIGNLILLILNIPLARIFVKLVQMPKYILHPLILIVCTVGVYSLNNSVFDIYLMLFFGVIGYYINKADLNGSSIILGMLFGSLFEEYFRRSLLISRGSFEIFYSSELKISLLIIAFTLLCFLIYKTYKNMRE